MAFYFILFLAKYDLFFILEENKCLLSSDQEVLLYYYGNYNNGLRDFIQQI